MKCPHCNQKAVFEATKTVTIRPTFENWKMDDGAHQLQSLEVVCLNCDRWSRVDFRSKYINPLDSAAVFDESTEKILEQARARRSELVPPKVLAHLRSQRYRRVGELHTGREVVSIILEQKPEKPSG